MFDDFKMVKIEIEIYHNKIITKKKFRVKRDEEISNEEYYQCIKELFYKTKKELGK